jgi:hypothetical protein
MKRNSEKEGYRPQAARLQSICQALKSFDRHRPDRAFGDWVEMMAIAFSNSVDHGHYDEREARYLQIASDYTRDEMKVFPRLMGELVLYLEREGYCDVFGQIFGELELQNSWRAQFFTPYHVSRMIARMTFDENFIRGRIEDQGFITACEPCCGAGGMVVAMAHALEDISVNYQKHLHVSAVDIDPRCVHMTYVTAALFHIPALIYEGNSISMEMRNVWATPAHFWGGWNAKLQKHRENLSLTERWASMPVSRRAELLEEAGADPALAVELEMPAILAEQPPMAAE